MDPAEIMAEKVRALMIRQKARDLFDSDFLNRKGYKTDIKLLDEKTKLYNTSLSKLNVKNPIDKSGENWSGELLLLVNDVDDLYDTKNNVSSFLSVLVENNKE
ncbi:MAG: nucleotidyl transferase AbiEii/AbiGii toxin family protein [Thermoplasmataceae archaeon]